MVKLASQSLAEDKNPENGNDTGGGLVLPFARRLPVVDGPVQRFERDHSKQLPAEDAHAHTHIRTHTHTSHHYTDTNIYFLCVALKAQHTRLAGCVKKKMKIRVELVRKKKEIQ